MSDSELDNEKPLRLIQSGINDILRRLAEMGADAERRDEVVRERMNRVEVMVWDHRERIERIEKHLSEVCLLGVLIESGSRIPGEKPR